MKEEVRRLGWATGGDEGDVHVADGGMGRAREDGRRPQPSLHSHVDAVDWARRRLGVVGR